MMSKNLKHIFGSFSKKKNGLFVDNYGNKTWYKDDKEHREDGPAYEGVCGTKIWYKDGFRHRTNGPAYEDFDGLKIWYKNGLIHRENGPALIQPNGSKQWYLNGEEISPSDLETKVIENNKKALDDLFPKPMIEKKITL